VGGGGYTIENVSRCWAYETGIALGEKIDGNIKNDDPYLYMYNN
jgi:histone deacetylase 1/2